MRKITAVEKKRQAKIAKQVARAEEQRKRLGAMFGSKSMWNIRTAYNIMAGFRGPDDLDKKGLNTSDANEFKWRYTALIRGEFIASRTPGSLLYTEDPPKSITGWKKLRAALEKSELLVSKHARSHGLSAIDGIIEAKVQGWLPK